MSGFYKRGHFKKGSSLSPRGMRVQMNGDEYKQGHEYKWFMF